MNASHAEGDLRRQEVNELAVCNEPLTFVQSQERLQPQLNQC